MLLLDNAQHLFLGDKRVTQIWTGVPNKNLLRPDLQVHTGTLNSYNSWTSSGFHVFIPIEVQGTYYFTQNQSTSNGVQIAVANENKYVISGSKSGNSSSSVDVKQVSVDTTEYPTAKYVVVCWYYDTFEWQMVLLNDSSTTYIPFEIQKKQIFDWKPYVELDWIQTSPETGGWEIDYIPVKENNMELSVAQMFAPNATSVGMDSGKGVIYSAGKEYAGHYHCQKSQYNYTSDFSYGIFNNDSNNKHINNSYGMNQRLLWDVGVFMLIKMQPSYQYLGSYSAQYSFGDYLPTANLMLGGEINGLGTSFVFGSQKFRSCRIYNRSTGEDVINLIPVLRKSDNTPCLYDTVNQKFYTTLGEKPTIYEVKS